MGTNGKGQSAGLARATASHGQGRPRLARALKMHEVAVEAFQMRAAIDKNNLSRDILRLGEIDHCVRYSRGRWQLAQGHHIGQPHLLVGGVIIG